MIIDGDDIGRIIDATTSGQPEAAAKAMTDYFTPTNALYNNLTAGV